MHAAINEWDEESFEQQTLRPDGVAVVDFWAGWCGPCRALAPVFESLAAEYGGRAQFGKVNVDDQVQAARRFRVRSIPCLVVLRGGREVARSEGLRSRAELVDLLEQALAG